MRRPQKAVVAATSPKLVPILGTAIADVGAKRVVPNTAVSWANALMLLRAARSPSASPPTCRSTLPPARSKS